MKKLIIFMVLVASSAFFVRAEEEEVRSPQAENDRDEEVAFRAKKRMYPGGADESDIRVQDPLPVPTRKVAPIADEPREEGSAD